jgi:hypothetical protein
MAVLNAWWPAALAVLVLAMLGGVLVVLRGRQRAPQSQKRSAGTTVEAGDTLVAWTPTATRVLTRAEREAYHIVRKALPDHMVLAQVPLARFLRVPTRNSYSEWLRRVGSLCADLVVCDESSQVVAVIELRVPVKQEKPRTVRRHVRMDRVLTAAGIPVHVWLEGALPGPAVAREAVLGAAMNMATKRPVGTNSQTRRSVEAAAVVASMQSAGAMHGMSVNEDDPDFNMDDFADEEASRKDPPPSTWFDDLESGPVPLEETSSHH